MLCQPSGGVSGVGFTVEGHDKTVTERPLLQVFIVCRKWPSLSREGLCGTQKQKAKAAVLKRPCRAGCGSQHVDTSALTF